MKMREINLVSLGLSEEHGETMDEILPGWRDMEVIEFADHLGIVTDEMRQESDGLQRLVEDLDAR